jgi:hypothetical protein
MNCHSFRPSSLFPGTACAFALLCAAPSFGADYLIKPKITVGEEYTDNVFDDRSNKADFITRIQPGILLKYSAPLWDWNLDYAYDYRYYARRTRKQDTTQDINASGLVKIVDEKLFLEVSDVYKRVSLDLARDTTNESLSAQQTDQNVGIVSPYLVLHPTSQLTTKTGYRYINTWYKEPNAVSKQDHVGFLNASYELSPKFSLTGDYSFTREIPVVNSSFNRQEAYLGPRYEYADKSFCFAKGGVIYTDYDNGTTVLNPAWSAGLTHTFETAVLVLSAGKQYSDDPLGASILQSSYSAMFTQSLKRGSLILLGSYTELRTENSSPVTINRQDNNTYSGGFTGLYEASEALQGTLGLTYQKYHDLIRSGSTDRYFVDCGLKYNFGKDLTAGLSYKYSDYSSAEIAIDNRRINRVILEVKKVF